MSDSGTTANTFNNEDPTDTAITGMAIERLSLRWWPVVVLLAIMFALPFLPAFFEAPSISVFMTATMGPALVGLLVLVWWLFASRASIKEKLLGLMCVVAIAFLAIAFLHPTMQGMGMMIHVFPAGMAAFAIPLVLLAARPSLRLPVAIASMALIFGYWDLMQSKGVTGKFVSELAWRWQPTSEEIYLDQLSDRKSRPIPDASTAPVSLNLTPINLATAQWPSFRGPTRDGKQAGIVLDEDWNQSPPKKLWQIPIGPAWSSFTVAGNYLFTQEQRGESEAVVCLDSNTGETIWSFEYPSRFWESVAGAGPRATPTIADQGLYALGADGILLCLNPQTGKEVWRASLRKDAQRIPPMWGFSASPLVVQGMVIVHAGGPSDKGILAYDALTGELKWSTSSGDHSYSSPQLATFDNETGVLMESNQGLQFLATDTGKTIWQHDWPSQNYRVLQPQVIGSTILIGTSLGEGTRSIGVMHESDAWKIDEKWTSRDMKPDFNDFVEHKGYIYGFDNGIFSCIDLATGKRKWKKGRYGSGQVVLLPDADQLLVASEVGELVLVKADPNKFIEVAKVPAIEGKTWNHPVVIGNRVYIRNAEQAACYQFATK